MRRFGILLSIFVALGALTAMWVASRLILVRNSWQQKVAKAKDDVLLKRVAWNKTEKDFRAESDELKVAFHGWERFWSNVQVGRGAQAGALIVGKGTNDGLLKDLKVYVFQPSADGQSSEFVGAFKVVEARDTQSALSAFLRFRPGDDTGWRYGDNWRLRINVPREHWVKAHEMEMTLVRKDELLATQLKFLDDEKDEKQSAEEHLLLRMGELLGKSVLPAALAAALDPLKLEPHFIEGLSKAVAEAETNRNAYQQDVDDLRRQVKRTRDLINKTALENERLARQSAESPPRTASKVP